MLPMQPPRPDVPWLVEICPASTLKKQHLYISYKGKGRERQAARQRILSEMLRDGSLRLKGGAISEAVVSDKEGDALDSLIAAAATFRAMQDIQSGVAIKVKNMVEGWVYV